MGKNSIIAILFVSAAAALASCEEFQPVFTTEYQNPSHYVPSELKANTTIAALAATYTHGAPFEMKGGKIIAGRVSTTDQPGNFYKSFYIQDQTGGMEIKMGKNGLYNDYHEGQMVYISCDGLFLGEYGWKSGSSYGNGMVQIGFDGKGTDYETSYLESSLLIDTHIFPGDPGDIQKVQPVEISQDRLPSPNGDLSNCPYLGKLVTIRDLTYGWYDSKYNENNEAFVLLYINSQKDKKASSNRIFISGENTGIDRWGLTKQRMSACLESGMWDNVPVGNANDYSYGKVGDPQYAYKGYRKDASGNESWEVDDKGNPIKTYPAIERAAYSVSQYFSTPNGTCVQVRTSGYGKFGDVALDPAVLSGEKKISVTGVLTLYQGKVQVTVNRITDITVQE